ncbi:hypothetical protein H8356DRAFT_1346893 [Neocallimastix lanati (nom. inval.)]|nr:hypothetical protein H8356DRAFT_1346893 [Neocallimastix sp. JGI-2020a]
MKSYSLYICDITNEIGIELAEDEHLNELGYSCYYILCILPIGSGSTLTMCLIPPNRSSKNYMYIGYYDSVLFSISKRIDYLCNSEQLY